VIIDQFNVKSVSVLKPENDAPIGSNRYGPISPTVALQPVQAITGEIESLWNVSSVKSRQNIFDSVNKICSDLTPVVPLEKSFQPPVLKGLNHFE
jgi:hypothetical protein